MIKSIYLLVVFITIACGQCLNQQAEEQLETSDDMNPIENSITVQIPVDGTYLNTSLNQYIP